MGNENLTSVMSKPLRLEHLLQFIVLFVCGTFLQRVSLFYTSKPINL